MKSLLSALVISAASIFPVSAGGIHDFNPANAAPTQTKARAGQGQCITTSDQSRVCYVKSTASDYSIAIRDIDNPSVVQVAHINCNTGRWRAFGGLTKTTLDQYLGNFCTHF